MATLHLPLNNQMLKAASNRKLNYQKGSPTSPQTSFPEDYTKVGIIWNICLKLSTICMFSLLLIESHCWNRHFQFALAPSGGENTMLNLKAAHLKKKKWDDFYIQTLLAELEGLCQAGRELCTLQMYSPTLLHVTSVPAAAAEVPFAKRKNTTFTRNSVWHI